jgi:hypothetical protein
VLVRSGLGLHDCTTETCIALKVMKRQASETLKLVGDIDLQSRLTTDALSRVALAGAVPLPRSLPPHSPLQTGSRL